MVNNKINVKTIKKTVPPIFVKNTTVGVKLSDIILFDITLMYPLIIFVFLKLRYIKQILNTYM